MLDSARAHIGGPAAQRFGRFLVVGALNSAVGYVLFVGFVLLRLVPEAALLLATVLGVMFNFLTTGRFVFANGDCSHLLNFVAVYAAVYVFNALVLRFLMMIAVPPLLAQLVLLPIAAIITFVALRNFVFKEEGL